MKKMSLFVMVVIGCALPVLTGCGGAESTVIEAPPATEIDEDAMEGMSDDDYDQAMDEDMEGLSSRLAQTQCLTGLTIPIDRLLIGERVEQIRFLAGF